MVDWHSTQLPPLLNKVNTTTTNVLFNTLLTNINEINEMMIC